MRYRPDMLRTSAIIDECYKQIELPQDNDPYIASFAEAAADHMVHGELGMIVTFALDIRAIDQPTHQYMFNVLRCAVQRQLLKRDPDYPTNGYERPEKYYQAINDIVNDTSAESELQADLVFRRIQTNIGERYKAHKLIMAALSPRLGHQPRFMDIGCSELQGPKQLHNTHTVPFSPVRLKPNTVMPDSSITEERINTIITSDSGTPGPVLGVDPVRPDITNGEWVIACSFKPGELANGERRQAFEKLRRLGSHSLYGYWKSFDEASMAQYDPTQYDAARPLDAFEVITFTTMLNQLPQHEIDAKRDIARRYLTKNGLIIYQDRVMADTDDGSSLVFLKDFNDFRYRTLIEFADDPKHTLHEVFQWETGRCKVARPGARLMHLLNGKFS